MTSVKRDTEAGISKRIHGLSSLIGNTPLLEINITFRGKPYLVYAKAEHMNMTGSIKDRIALHIIKEAYASGAIRPGYRIIEATSGNTGIAFSSVSRALGHHVTIFMPDWMSDERKNLIKSLGAEIELVSKEEGGFLSTDVRLNSFVALKRNCITCCNPEECSRTVDPAVMQDIVFPACYLRSLKN